MSRSCLVAPAIGLSLSLALSGCLSGPDYQRPPAFQADPLPSVFANATNQPGQVDWKESAPAAHLPRGPWWEVFNDAELNRLESRVAAANQELAASRARIEQARALVQVARAGWFPQADLHPEYSRQRTSVNQAQQGKPANASSTFGSWTIPIEASWELDLWGRVRRQVEAARAQLAASADDLQGATLSIQAETATDYFTLRGLEAELEVLRQSAENFRRSLELTQNRRRGGIATDLDVAQAETQLRIVEAEIPGIELQRTRVLNALSTLCGQPASLFKVAPGSNRDLPQVPGLLPSELLERRPDIAAAERRVAAANAEIGVAQTAFYPRIVLNGLAGLQSVSASTLFDWPSRFWAVGPRLELPLFTGGRNRARLAATKAAYDEAVAQYRQTVLVGFQEVEDQLAANRLLTSQVQAEDAALTASRRTLEIANNRYRSGLVTYLEVATAQTAALARERTVIQLRAQRLIASAGLIRALGGGWQADSQLPPRLGSSQGVSP